MTDIKFYYSPGHSSLASHILLHESNLDFEAIKIDVTVKFPESMRHLNPKMRVPILFVSGESEGITETPAIMLAIAQLCKRPELVGQTDMERVRVAEWMNWLSGTVHAQGVGNWNRPYRVTSDESMHDAVRAKAKELFADCLGQIEDKLSGTHAVGGHLTVVDVFLYMVWRWGTAKGFAMKDNYPRYAALAAEMSKMPSVRKTIEVEGIEGYFL